MSEYTALDNVIVFHAATCDKGSECDLTALSRAELAALRQRVAELEASRAELMAELAAYGNADAPNGATLTPRKCEHCNPLKP